jgi:hypothetical protein
MENYNLNHKKSCQCTDTENRHEVINSLKGPDKIEFYNTESPISYSNFKECDKNSANGENTSSSNSLLFADRIGGVTFDYSDWPVVKNNTLVFRDNTHLDSYQQFLEKAIIVPPNTNNTEESQDPDDILQRIENKIGFTSLRNIAETEFRRLGEIGWDRLEDIPAKHFIFDIITRSVLNPNLEAEVGGKILTVIKHQSQSNEQSYSLNFIKRNDTDMFGSLRLSDNNGATSQSGKFDLNPVSAERWGGTDLYGTSAHSRQYDLNPVSGKIWDGIDLSGTTSHPGQFDLNQASSKIWDDIDLTGTTSQPGQYNPTSPVPIGTVPTISSGVRVEAKGHYIPFTEEITASDCNGDYKKITITGMGLFDVDTNKFVIGVIFEINWGDGTPNETKIGTEERYNSYSHNYALDGAYVISIKFSYPAGNLIRTIYISIEIPIKCSGMEGWQIHTWGYRPAGNRAIRCSTGLYYPLHSTKQRVFAFTEAFHWDRTKFDKTWKWRPYNGAIRILAEYTIFFGKTEGYRCIPDGTDSASTKPWWAKEAHVEQTGPRRGWRYIKSIHEMHNTDKLGDIRVELFVKPCQSNGNHPRFISKI